MAKRYRMNRRTIRRNLILLAGILVMLLLLVWIVRLYPAHNQGGEHQAGGTDTSWQQEMKEKYPAYHAKQDADGDGVDDQTDFLRGVKAYLKTTPKYRSQYYQGGYPDDGYGVCTDVVAFGAKAAGYDLRALIDRDCRAHPAWYPGIQAPDSNIDFRRVPNQNAWFRHHAKALTKDPRKVSQWRGGDIVVFRNHIGVVSDRRNRAGICYVLHHNSRKQKAYAQYEQDILLKRQNDIISHYRWK